MKIKINKNYINYLITTLFLLLDAIPLLVIKDNTILGVLYFIFKLVFIYFYCLKCSVEDSAIFSILFILFYTFFIDVFIHYFHKIVIFEMEFLFIIPLLITYLRIKNNRSKVFSILSILYIVFNAFLFLFYHKVDFTNYSMFMVNIFSFIGFYYIYSNLDGTKKLIDLYKYIFCVSFLLTIVQTVLGFNEDTRNGVFSVFGWGAYSFFIMIFFMYNLRKYLYKEKSLLYFVFITFICLLLYICTESKAALVVMFINIVFLLIARKGLTYKQLFFLILGILLVPLSYKLLIYFTPKFSHLNNIHNIIRYFVGNNNTRYEYGRFEALSIVFSKNDYFKQIFGIGFGGSCPLYKVFFEELGRAPLYPYYTVVYGYKFGYQHTTSAILLLDGGLLLFSTVVIFIINKIVDTVKKVRIDDNNCINIIKFGVLVYLVYYFVYANVLKDFRIMALLGIVLGMNNFIIQDTRGESDLND